MRGVYVVIEGPDGTGKTTQAELLAASLRKRGIASIHVKEPGGTPIGEKVREVILNGTLARTPLTNLLLFTAIRQELWQSVIKPALADGTWVICTRNYWSSIAFQGYGEGMDIELIRRTTETYTDEHYMNPDIKIMLTFEDEQERSRRIAERGELEHPDTFETKAADFQQRVNDAYAVIAADYAMDIVDASGTPDDIATKISAIIESSGVLDATDA